MSLIEHTLFGKTDKVAQAIHRLKAFEPNDGYHLAYSGGKDSIVIKRLTEMAQVEFEAVYSLTSVDPPELVQFIKRQPDVTIDIPRNKSGQHITMWNLIPRKGIPPTQIARYCCEELKERSGKGKITVTGIRWAESVRRKRERNLVDIGGKRGIVYNDDNDDARRMVENCYRTKRTILNPIIDWTDAEVWEFIRAENVPYCELYDQGFKRLGCIGCPMSSRREEEFKRYPTYKTAYLRAFGRMIQERERKGLDISSWETPEKVMAWWMHGTKKQCHPLLDGVWEEDGP